MKTDKSVHAKTKYLLIFFSFIVLAQLITTLYLGTIEYIAVISATAVINICLIFMLYRKLYPTFIMPTLIVVSHFYVVSLFFTKLEFSLLYFLLFPIIISLLYKNNFLAINLLILTTLEIFAISQLSSSSYQPINSFTLVILVSLLVGIFSLILFSMQTTEVSLSRFKESEEVRASLSSPPGYLELFFEHTQDAIAVFTINHKIIAVNPAFEELYQWKKEECIGKNIKLYHPSEQANVNERIQFLLEGRHYKNLRTKEIRKDGSMFEAETTMAPIFNKKNKVIAISVIVRNISDRLLAEHHKMEAIKLNAIGEMAASVAHEVRNPMTSIKGFVQMMNDDPSNPYRAFTKIMESEILRINLIANEFLILSKPNIKESKEIDLENMIFEVIEHLNHELTERNIVCYVYMAEFQSTIIGNEESIKQVLINLIKNSIDASGKDGHITFINSIINDSISITIKDDGHGIDKAALSQLFIPFFTTKQGAAGLGLVITKKIILDHNGTIEVNGLASEGAEVTVTFPICSITKTKSSALHSK